MRRTIPAGALSAAMTLSLTPLVRRALLHTGGLDIPNERSSHFTPVPRGGGIAAAIGTLAGRAAYGSPNPINARNVITISSLTLLGLADDQFGGLSPRVRMAIQLANGYFIADSPPVTSILHALGTAGTVNAINFMDGIDGISAATIGTWGITTAIVGHQTNDLQLQALGAVCAGSCLGFLPWNALNAKIFLGDVGSYHLAALVASAISAPTSWRTKVRVALPLTLYFADVTSTLIKRRSEGLPLTVAHRDHIYQHLVDEHNIPHIGVALSHALAAAIIGHRARKTRTLNPAILLSAIMSCAYLTSPHWLRALNQQLKKGIC